MPAVSKSLTRADYHAYTRAMQWEDARYQQAADRFKRKRSPTSEEMERTARRRRA